MSFFDEKEQSVLAKFKKSSDSYTIKDSNNKENDFERWLPDDLNEKFGETPKPVRISENAIIDAISSVYDPEIPVNIYELGLIYAIDLNDDGCIHVEMTLTAPNCPSAQELPLMVKEALETIEGVKKVEVEIVWDPPWDISRMSDEARLTLNMF